MILFVFLRKKLYFFRKLKEPPAAGWDFIPPSRLWPAPIRTKQSSSRVICPWVSARNDEPTDWFYSFLSKSSWSFAHFWAKVPGFSQNWGNGCLKNLRPLQIWRKGSSKLRSGATRAKLRGFKDGVTKRAPIPARPKTWCTDSMRQLNAKLCSVTPEGSPPFCGAVEFSILFVFSLLINEMEQQFKGSVQYAELGDKMPLSLVARLWGRAVAGNHFKNEGVTTPPVCGKAMERWDW